MEIESFNSRLNVAPPIEQMTVVVKKYEEKTTVDDSGIVHTSLVEKTSDDFLDVPFRDYSMSSYVATGEVTRLKFISPMCESKLDMYDSVQGASEELSARVNHLELMQKAAETAVESNKSE